MNPKPFSLPLIVPAAALLCALAAPAGAQPGSLVRNETVTEAKKHERQTRERQCEVMLDDAARLKCQADAKAERKEAVANANAEFRESLSQRKSAGDPAEQALETQRRQALERCGELKAAARKSCEEGVVARYGK